MKNIEYIVLSNLIHNENYTRKVLPFLKEEYFSEETDKILYKTINEFVLKYNISPTIESLEIDIQDKKISESSFKIISEKIQELRQYEKVEEQWLLENTEKFCKDKALYNAIIASIDIIDGNNKKISKDGIPTLLQEALAVGFDSSVGHDYNEDGEKRYEFYTSDIERIPFDIDILNKITKGGLPNKSLTVLMAGCIHPETLVEIQYDNKTEQVQISKLKQLIKHYPVYINSPDGFVKVVKYIEKGTFQEYELNLVDGRSVKCNDKHLFETALGWQFAEDLVNLPEQHYLTDQGYILGFIEKNKNIIPIVDIEVEHENHRYYANGISSHNTGVGKSMVLCHLAASYICLNKNVLYITLEMSEERIAERIDANLLNININSLSKIKKSEFQEKINKLFGKINGKLIIKEYPATSAHVGHFESLINELYLKKKFKPDVIIVDYLNICSSQRMSVNNNSYFYIKSIAEEIRGLSTKKNLPIITATQTNRCLDINTEVYTPTGKIKIKDVKEGMMIHSSGNNWVKVLKVYPIEKQECFKIFTKNSSVICSKKHIFPSLNDENISVESGLSLNSILFGGKFNEETNTLHEYIDSVIKIEEVGERETIDISCDGNNLFYANDILTHNSGYSNSDVEITDISESFGISHTVDLMLALISSDELEKMNQLMIKQLKNRYNDPSYFNKFVVGIDRSRMRLYDTEDSSQRDIVREERIKDSYKENFSNPFESKKEKTNKFNNLKV